MFEDKASDHTSDLLKGVNCNVGLPRVRQINSIDVEDAFHKGTEVGYNKGKVELDKAVEIIEGLMRFCRCFAQHRTQDVRYKDAEQFLKEIKGNG